jgi:ArsR family transcriptional regulator, arsenate/arsenite/antimonite-responsive transcriptional repressor
MENTAAAAAFAALGHPVRLAALRELVEAGPDGLASGEIADKLGIGPTAMSFHLSTLARVQLVRSWRDGRNIRYSAEFAVAADLLAFLTQSCCGGHPERCGDLTRAVRRQDNPQQVD